MLVNLYTVRVVLQTLGVEDFGIYNVVGGVVVMFTFLNSAMTNATQRFLNFALGRNDIEQARDVYSTGIIIHALIAMVVVVLAQTVGLWFFHTWLNIPSERQGAAFIVYQFSIAATVIGIMQVPYRATIIAYEKMSFFAMLGIVEAVLKLSIAFLLPVLLFDKLIVYAVFVCVTTIVICLIHKVYCNRMLETARFRYCRDKELFRRLLGFSGWVTFIRMADLGRDQGANMLVNIFHGVTLNASMGIAMQVNTAVFQILGNFQTAFRPQIIKTYAAKDNDGFMRLVFQTAKASFCLMLFFILPLYINADFILRIWLGDAPEYSIQFIKLSLLLLLTWAVAGALAIPVEATGNLKRHHLIVSCFTFANLPLYFLFLWMGFSPVWIFITRIGVEVLLLVWRIFFLGGMIKLPVKRFFCRVIVPLSVITGIAFIVGFLAYGLFDGDWGRLIASCVASVASIGFLAYLIGLDRQEKVLLRNWIKARIGKTSVFHK